MHHDQVVCASRLRSLVGIGWMQSAVFALALSLALPARAGDDRAVKTRVPPVYPEIAKRLRITGEVKLEATVDADGKVKAVKAVSGNHVLGEAAEEAVRKWRFEAGTGDAIVVVGVNFSLAQQ
jgi:TonB family protein